MARTPTDALRSMKRYISVALGPEWEVRLTGEEGAFNRPFARVGPIRAASVEMVGATQRIMSQTFSIVCHPVERHTPDEALMEAEAVRSALLDALTMGVHEPAFRDAGRVSTTGTTTTIRRRGHPMRVPLYDYAGVPLTEAVTDDASDGFMRVTEAVTVDVIPDPNDELRYAIAVAAPMSWAVSAAVRSARMTVERVQIEEG